MLLLLFVYGILSTGEIGKCPKIDSRIQEIVNWGISEVNLKDGTELVLDQIIECRSQIVAGVRYFLKADVTDKGNSYVQYLDIWEDPQQKKHLMKFRKIQSGLIAGGWSDCAQNLNDPEMVNTLADVMKELQKRSNSAFKLKLVKVMSCQTQIVAGEKFKFTLLIGGSPDGSTFTQTVEVFKGLSGDVENVEIEK